MTTVELPDAPAIIHPAPPVPSNAQQAAPPARLISLDAFRGAIMLLMASAGFGLAQVAKSFPDSAVWRFIGYETEHADWNGCALWDLIQPAFMFMVGIALPWSIANRQARGEPFGRMFAHAVWRAVLLILLAIIFTSAYAKQTDWIFTNVLAQIGLGYPFLFLLAFTGRRTPWIAAGGILVAYWLAFALHPLPPAGFDWPSVGVPADWPHHFKGFAAHWEKNFNFAATFDQWFLNRFPRATGFVFSKGGYQTLNFIPSVATMTFGLIAGRLLRSDLALQAKLLRLVIAGVAGIALGALIDAAGLCPIVKRIWTPSWVLFSGGWCFLSMAAFHGVIDVMSLRAWAFPLIVIGANAIAAYLIAHLFEHFLIESLNTNLGWLLKPLAPYDPFARGALVLVIFWLILFWMYRRKIFLKV
jgi:predicted acyltransferase